MKPAEKVLFLYRVKHPVHGEIEVEAVDRLRAVAAAGRAWGVPWTTIARECICERMGPATDKKPAAEQKKKSRAKKPAKPAEKTEETK